MRMSIITSKLELPLKINRGFGHGLLARLNLLAHPLVAFSWLLRIALSIAFVAAVVYAAWKVGSYYDAAKKKL